MELPAGRDHQGGPASRCARRGAEDTLRHGLFRARARGGRRALPRGAAVDGQGTGRTRRALASAGVPSRGGARGPDCRRSDPIHMWSPDVHGVAVPPLRRGRRSAPAVRCRSCRGRPTPARPAALGELDDGLPGTPTRCFDIDTKRLTSRATTSQSSCESFHGQAPMAYASYKRRARANVAPLARGPRASTASSSPATCSSKRSPFRESYNYTRPRPSRSPPLTRCCTAASSPSGRTRSTPEYEDNIRVLGPARAGLRTRGQARVLKEAVQRFCPDAAGGTFGDPNPRADAGGSSRRRCGSA